jgi:hypothetical protein
MIYLVWIISIRFRRQRKTHLLSQTLQTQQRVRGYGGAVYIYMCIYYYGVYEPHVQSDRWRIL